ncbi:hypothetical protein [Fulvivirga kasyanovii]|uniref:Transposase n=1 Tax=Fulvivirga kasyanovii TaxID=396812 RepID=A0ABW9RH88_9BACT|nr:hypothetical protein [Fulvivirga kasyanovii]MTI23417.1 hypothetical protein [Fulvivirga kasyanovii]
MKLAQVSHLCLSLFYGKAFKLALAVAQVQLYCRELKYWRNAYNHLNLPAKVTKDAANYIDYIYDAQGLNWPR